MQTTYMHLAPNYMESKIKLGMEKETKITNPVDVGIITKPPYRDNTKVRVHMRISKKTKSRLDRHLILRHGMVKGVRGQEIENAINAYLDRLDGMTTLTHVTKKINKNTLATLRLILNGLKDVPSFPLINPMSINSIIKDWSQHNDLRTISKYKKIILDYSKEEAEEGELFPRLNVKEFSNYVARLSMESHMD